MYELDASIDDWVSKLERAENRRTRVRQKLLEHVAAALTLQPTENSQPTRCAAESTPPRSPVKMQSPQRLAEHVRSPDMTASHEVESIRIYADSDVHALLAEVEEEMSRMQHHSDTFEEMPAPEEFTLAALTFSPPPAPSRTTSPPAHAMAVGN